MQVQVQAEDNQIVITAVGELDAHNCGELGQAVATATDKHPGRPAVIDASGLTFIDSSAISELLRLREGLTKNGATLTLTNVQPSVKRVLEITGLLTAFGV